MKISYMLKRENFYEINEKTLKRYYSDCKTEKNLYIYPELNAIVSSRPSSAVKRYLYTEYHVSGSFFKRLAVRVYAFIMLNSLGLFASKRVKLPTSAKRDTLIYPCNKKYRIFDFKNGTVTVTPKEHFPTGDIKNEISFRSSACAEFIPAILSSSENEYTERIIDGYPVARAAGREKELSDRIFEIWERYSAKFNETVSRLEYADTLSREIDSLLGELAERGKDVCSESVLTLTDKLISELMTSEDTLTLSLSHGDLQSGNIWVENGTDKIYIIDWESYGRRSVDYDKATLYDGIRRTDRLAVYVKIKDVNHATVLLEDLIFRLKELTNLPEDYGVEDFAGYIKILEERYV